MNPNLTRVWIRKWDENWMIPSSQRRSERPEKAQAGWSLARQTGNIPVSGALSPLAFL